MKKILLFLGILLLTTSCKKSKQEKLQNEIESKIKIQLNDPNSYEFNYFYLDSLEYMTNKEEIKIILKDIQNLNKQKDVKSEKMVSLLKSKSEFLQSLNKNKYKGTFSFRANNKFGAKILAEYAFEADSTYTVLYLINNNKDTIYKDEVIINDEITKDIKKLQQN
ncbi:hypothetical protein [Flavobacterium sp. HTF]|uniref:hypothetical protein n=1 Tax=Flavobacterium sp. HTF TaxID=2170732 RepID=UPI000D5FB4C1|nr:hypothetical protein [Flavobacterium sp. HTF]PWB27539.1 hypothetical protein DCO46_03230 [Flavobacterium sp. HTF]